MSVAVPLEAVAQPLDVPATYSPTAFSTVPRTDRCAATLFNWRARPAFVRPVDEIRSAFRDAGVGLAVADRRMRLERINEAWLAGIDLVDQRAAQYSASVDDHEQGWRSMSASLAPGANT